jgi:hypothetical protein
LKEEGIILELKVLIMSSDIKDFKFALKKVLFIPMYFILCKNILFVVNELYFVVK